MPCATTAAVGLACKAFLSLRLATAAVDGLPILAAALADAQRTNRGVVTVANHISTLDDPVAWGVLPARYYFDTRTTRWALGAADIMFTNPVFSAFFRHGQVLETFRGKGIYQPAVDAAIQKLDAGGWVHLFGEGKVNQPDTYAHAGGRARLPRFKWGVGRVLVEAATPPVVIPMWLSGFDKLMPEGRPFPAKYLPRLGTRLGVTFGEPLPPDALEGAIQTLGTDRFRRVDTGKGAPGAGVTAWMGDEVQGALSERRARRNAAIVRVREEVTTIVHDAVEALGRQVSGDMLGGPKR